MSLTKKRFSLLKWLILLIILWLGFQLMSILTFPKGELSDSAEAAVVLGAAVYHKNPSPVFAERINHAINLYHVGKVKTLIFTGGVAPRIAARDKNTLAESVVARDYAIKNRVDSKDILIETQSHTTQGNLYFANEILKREQVSSVLIVSDALHSKRALLMAKRLGIKAQASATPTSLYKTIKTRLPFALRELYFYHHYLLFDE